MTDVLLASDRLGAPAGPALTRLAHDVRTDLRRRAEARARTLPVKLLFPLVFLVLPAFGLLTVVPALLTALVPHLSRRRRSSPIAFGATPKEDPCSVVSSRRSAARSAPSAPTTSELGQTTAEYALVILGAAALATLLITWATKCHAITKLFDTVIGKVLG